MDPNYDILINRSQNNIEEIKKIIKESPQYIDKVYHREAGSLLMRECEYPLRDGAYELIELLIDLGDDVNRQDRMVRGTPLYIICSALRRISRNAIDDTDGERKILKIIKLLLKKGADVNKLDINNNNILYTLLVHRWGETINYSRITKKVARMLIEKMDINIIKKYNVQGDSVMPNLIMIIGHESCNSENKKIGSEIASMIIDKGFNIKKYSSFAYGVFVISEHRWKKKEKKLNEKIKKLERQVEELKYKPNNPGYFEAMEDFDNLVNLIDKTCKN